jgi:hypothetical protein
VTDLLIVIGLEWEATAASTTARKSEIVNHRDNQPKAINALVDEKEVEVTNKRTNKATVRLIVGC